MFAWHLCPFKKNSKNKPNFKDMLWMTSGLQKAVFIKSHYLSKLIRLNEPCKKEEAHIKYKEYRNLSSTLLKPSKQLYFRFFQENTEGLKYTQKGIKMISLNNFIRVQLKCS